MIFPSQKIDLYHTFGGIFANYCIKIYQLIIFQSLNIDGEFS